MANVLKFSRESLKHAYLPLTRIRGLHTLQLTYKLNVSSWLGYVNAPTNYVCGGIDIHMYLYASLQREINHWNNVALGKLRVWWLACWKFLYFQVESTLAMQNLQPKIKAIQERYKGNQVSVILHYCNVFTWTIVCSSWIWTNSGTFLAHLLRSTLIFWGPMWICDSSECIIWLIYIKMSRYIAIVVKGVNLSYYNEHKKLECNSLLLLYF